MAQQCDSVCTRNALYNGSIRNRDSGVWTMPVTPPH